MTAIHLAVYAAFLILGVGVIARIVRIMAMPLHLRWELYPVPHEGKRARYGGSRLEEVNWWTKEHHPNHITEMWAMAQEIILLKGVWEHNRSLWWGSFALHFGLYLLIGERVMVVIAAILGGSTPPEALLTLIRIAAWAGYLLGVIGAILMLGKRLFDPNLKAFTTSSHLFNLFLLGALNVTGLTWIASDPEYAANFVGFISGLVNPSEPLTMPATAYGHIGVWLLFLVYFPFTHMTHAFVKYFTYHFVRWEDMPNLPGGKLQAVINRLEGQVVTWAAPHIGANGKKTWVDIVGETGEEKP